MASIGQKLRLATDMLGHKWIMHWCPGCEGPHGIRIEGPDEPKWSFNGDYETPHFEPSVHCFYTETTDDDDKPLPAPVQVTLCHYFIHHGRIVFCGDSPHKFAGQTVEIPDWPYAPGTYGGIDE